MYELKKIGKAFTNILVGTGPSSYKKRIYRAAVSQRLRNTAVNDLFALVGCYTALISSYLPTFRDNFSDPSSMVSLSQKNVFLKFLTFADGDDRLSQNSVNDYYSTLRNI